MSPISPKAASPSIDRDAPGGRGDRERDPEVGPGLVDADAARDVDEDVRVAERQTGVAGEHRDDHREALGVDAGADAPRHREVGRRDEGLDLDQERPRPLERARHRGADLAGLGLRRRSRRARRRRRARSPVISKTASSFVEPKRFFVARSMRCAL